MRDLIQFVRSSHDYSAQQAGIVLSPVGIALALLMPVAGIWAMKFDPRKVIAEGLLLTSVSMPWMLRISLYADFSTVVWMRVFQFVGIPLISIPISTLAHVGMRQQDNNQVSGISNFVRNLGGAIGVSFLVSYLTRHQQSSRIDLVAHRHRGNVFFDRFMAGLQRSAVPTGESASDSSGHALAQIQQLVDAQASEIAFMSAFFVLGVIVAFPIPLPFLMKRPSVEDLAASHG